MTSIPPLVQLEHVSKSYGGVHALHDVLLDIRAGEVHAICGENGAGKSTLIKILTGVVAADAGRILLDGAPHAAAGAQAAQAAGIAVMHQESTVFPDLTAAENVFVGHEPKRWGGLWLDRAAMERQTRETLHMLGENFSLNVPVHRLTLAQRQMVALARALVRQCRLLIMDEPTASLSLRETRALLSTIRSLRAAGVAVLYVSHRLEDIFQIADRVTVLRDGQHVATRGIAELGAAELIRMMVGRELAYQPAPMRSAQDVAPVVLEVRQLTRGTTYQDISFTVRAGEVLGLAGLVGAGRSEIARGIFGIDRYERGEVLVAGKRLPPGQVAAALDAGIALVPEDRQHEGLVLPMSVAENLSLARLPALGRYGLVQRDREAAVVQQQIHDLQVKAASPHVPAETLSGGNQQKLVLGKWLACAPSVLLLDEPTRGIDVGAKAQVHALIAQQAARGRATVLISSELPELLAVCDRILVIRGGRVAGELAGSAATQEQILALALPDREEPAA